MNIVIADADEETRLALVEAILSFAPRAHLREAIHGGELQAALSGPAPDILFIDTVLPDTNAETVTTWRAGPGAESVVVLVADLLSSRWAQVAKRLDAYDVLLKPLTAQNVRHVLAAAAVLRRNMTLLLVEPSAKTRELTRKIIDTGLFRFHVTEAENGKSAVKAAALRSFDFAFIGPNIPDMPPSEVVCRIDALSAGTRIVMTGAASQTPSPSQLALFGAHAFLPLPFSTTALDCVVYETFGLWRPYLLEALRRESAQRDAELAALATAR